MLMHMCFTFILNSKRSCYWLSENIHYYTRSEIMGIKRVIVLVVVITADVWVEGSKEDLGTCAAGDIECKQKTPGMTMPEPSNKQIEHWRQWFTTLDTNHDDVLSGKDRDVNIQRHLDAYELDDNDPVAEKIVKWWNECVLLGHEDELSSSNFIDIQTENYKRLSGNEGYRDSMNRCLLDIFEACDADGDGFYTEEEYQQIYENFGHHAQATDRDAFNSYDPVNGKVQLVKLAKAWTEFVTGTDADHKIVDMIADDGIN